MPKRSTDPKLDDLVFVGFNRRVIAVDRYDGRIIWDWRAPKGSGFVALLLDGDRLIASVNGYTYCLDPIFGQVVWSNEFPGMGVGVPSITSVRGASISAAQAAMIAQQQAAAAAAAG